MQPLPPKKEVALALLERSSVHVHLDPRRDGVMVPPWLRKQPQLLLQVGLNMPVPIPDLHLDDQQLTCTLSFNRSPFFCVIPWGSVYAMVGEDGRGMVWPDDIPGELARPTAPPRLAVAPAPPPPTLTLAKPPPGTARASKPRKPTNRKKPELTLAENRPATRGPERAEMASATSKKPRRKPRVTPTAPPEETRARLVALPLRTEEATNAPRDAARPTRTGRGGRGTRGAEESPAVRDSSGATGATGTPAAAAAPQKKSPREKRPTDAVPPSAGASHLPNHTAAEDPRGGPRPRAGQEEAKATPGAPPAATKRDAPAAPPSALPAPRAGANGKPRRELPPYLRVVK